MPTPTGIGHGVAVIALKECDRLLVKPGEGGMPSSNWIDFSRRFISLADLYDLKSIIIDGLTSGADGAVSESDLQLDKIARHAIMASITDTELVDDCATAHDMWSKLAGRFEAHTLSHEMFLRDQLNNKKFQLGQSLDSHIDHLIKIRGELKSIGAGSELTDSYMTKRLIQSMPYEHFATVIDALDETQLDFNNIRLKLMGRHSRLLAQSADKTGQVRPPPAAFVAGFDSSPSSRRPLPPCVYCGRTNHPSQHCYQQFGKEVVESAKLAARQQAAHPPAAGRQTTQLSSLVACPVPAPVAAPVPGTVALLGQQARVTSIPERPCRGFAFTAHTDRPSPPSQGQFPGWILDSGASNHFCYDLARFHNYSHLEEPVHITVGGQSNLMGVGTGDVLISYVLNGQVEQVTLRDTLYIPGAHFNLLSIGVLDEAGNLVTFGSGECKVFSPQGQLMLSAKKLGSSTRLYHLFECAPPAHVGLSVVASVMSPEPVTPISANLLHARLGHVNVADMKRLLTMADGIAFTGQVSETCVPCIMAKQTCSSVPQVRTTHTTEVLDLVHSDIAGPFPVPGLHGERYFVLFIDDYSRMVWVRLLRTRDEVLPAFIEWKTFVETQTGKKIKAFRSDGAMEYQSSAFSSVLSESGIQRQTSASYTQAQNGVSERFVRTVKEYGRAMLFFADLPKPFWSVAVEHACYLRNRLPTRALDNKTPYETWFGRKPDLRHLRVFGCKAYAHIPDELTKELEEKSRRCLYIGVPGGTKGFRLYDLDRVVVFNSIHVRFDEQLPELDVSDVDAMDDLFELDDQSDVQPSESSSSSTKTAIPVAEDNYLLPVAPSVDISADLIPVDQNPFASEPSGESTVRRSGRQRSVPDRLIHAGRLADQFGIPTDTSAQQPTSSTIEAAPAATDSAPVPSAMVMPPVIPPLQVPSCSLPPEVASSPAPQSVPPSVSSNPDQTIASVIMNGRIDCMGCCPVIGAPAAAVQTSHPFGPVTTVPFKIDDVDYAKLFSSGFALVSLETPLNSEPVTFRQALNSPDAESWITAMKEEYQSLIEAGTFMLVQLPKGANLVSCRWVFKLKLNPDGTVNRHKARLVARGFTQRHGIDYDLTFAPVVKLQSIRALLAIAAALGWEIHQMDVVTAYLNGELEHEIYMAQPEGFVNNENKGLVCLLKKSLYGLKQAGRSWNHKIHEVLVKLGFRRLEADYCVYHFRLITQLSYGYVYTLMTFCSSATILMLSTRSNNVCHHNSR